MENWKSAIKPIKIIKSQIFEKVCPRDWSKKIFEVKKNSKKVHLGSNFFGRYEKSLKFNFLNRAQKKKMGNLCTRMHKLPLEKHILKPHWVYESNFILTLTVWALACDKRYTITKDRFWKLGHGWQYYLAQFAAKSFP